MTKLRCKVLPGMGIEIYLGDDSLVTRSTLMGDRDYVEKITR